MNTNRKKTKRLQKSSFLSLMINENCIFQKEKLFNNPNYTRCPLSLLNSHQVMKLILLSRFLQVW